MSNRGLFVVVIVILLGILTVVVIDANKATSGDIANDIGELTEKIIGDDMKYHADAR